MASLSFYVSPPASEVEWKPINVTVRLIYQLPDGFSQGTFYLNLKYGGTTVWSDSQFVSGLTPAFFEENEDVDFIIGTRCFYSGAEVEAIFIPNAGVSEYTSQFLDITPAFREFTGGPYGRMPVEGCRWDEELITVTMREFSVGPIITTYGQKIEDGTYVDYGLTSTDGFIFKDSLGGSIIPSIQFFGGTATFVIGMNDETAGGVFTFTDQEPGWSADTYDSDSIDVVNPTFIWQNFYNGSNEAQANSTITNGQISAQNPFNSSQPANFPDNGWTLSIDPGASASSITYGSFAGGVLSNINVAYTGAPQANVHFDLEYSGSPACTAESAVFDITAVTDNISPTVISSSASVT